MRAVLILSIPIVLAAWLHSAEAHAQIAPNFVECSISPAGALTCASHAGGSCTTINSYSKTCTGGGTSVTCSKDMAGRVSCTPPGGSTTVCYVESETAKCYARSIKPLLQSSPPVVAFGDAVISTSKAGYPQFTPATSHPQGYTIIGFHITGEFQITALSGTCSGYATYPNGCTVQVSAKPRFAGTRHGTLTMVTDRGSHHLPLTVVGTGFAAPTASDKNAGTRAGLLTVGATAQAAARLTIVASSKSAFSCDAKSPEPPEPPEPAVGGPLGAGGAFTSPGSFAPGIVADPGTSVDVRVVDVVPDDPTNPGLPPPTQPPQNGGGGGGGGPSPLVPIQQESVPIDARLAPLPAPALPASGTPGGGPAGNLGAGNAAHTQIDYAGRFANPLSFVRTYNSAGFGSTTSIRQHVGVGWRTNWDQSIVLGANGTTATMHRSSGASYVYNYDAGANKWTTSSDVTGTLAWVKDANRYPYGWTFTHPSGITERYDAIGRLYSVEKIQGARYTLTYDAKGQLSQVDNHLFRYLTFAYDGEGRLVSMTNPAGGVTEYTYDTMSRMTQIRYPDLTTRQFRYENATYPFALTAVIDGKGLVYASYGYDTEGRIVSGQVGGAGTESVTYHSPFQVTFTDTHGASWIKTMSIVSGRVLLTSESVACTGCPSQAEQFAYNVNGALTSKTSRNGVQTTYTHNARKLPQTVVEAHGRPEVRTTTVTWHPTLDLPATVANGVNTVSYQYDGQGRVTAKTVAGGGLTRTTTYAYNSIGRVIQINGPRTDAGDVTTYEYDGVGNLLVETNPLGQKTRYSQYNGHGQPQRIEYPNLTVKTISYDIRGRVLTETLAGRTTSYTYDANGNLATTTTNDGNVATNRYDDAHRLIGIDNSKGESIVYARNGAGLITRTDTFDNGGLLVSTTRSAYDGLGRRTQHIDAEGRITRYTYDAVGNVTAVTDPRSKVTYTHYDPLNRPVRIIDPLNGNTVFGYDAADRLTSFTDTRGNTTQYSFNALGDNTVLTSPDTGTTNYSFDAAGNTLTKVDARGKSTSYAYDAAGRLVRVTYGGIEAGQVVTRTYDVASNGVGQLASVTDLSGTTSYTYDANGRVASKTQQVQGVTLQVSYTRDALGRVTQILYPSANTLNVTYDSFGRPSQLTRNASTVVLSGVQYFPFGGPESWLFGGAYEYTRYIDLNGRVSGYRTPTGTRTLTYDAADRITRSAEGTKVQNFTYDDLGRLLTFSGFTSAAPAETRSYEYDANGNRRTSAVNSVSATYAYGAGNNRLNSVSGLYTNSYDAAGNLVSDGRLSHTYDTRGRLVQTVVPNPGGTTLTYHYNDRNQRVGLWDSAANAGKVWLYEEEGRMLAEYTAPGGVRVHELMWLGSTPVAVAGTLFTNCGAGCSGVALAYIWPDHLDTPRAITDQAGVKVWEWESAPFGDTPPMQTSTRGTMALNHRFPGQYFDSATGLHQNMHRDYDPRIGRYIQPDPIGLIGGANLYAYVVANPLSFADYTGLDATVCLYSGAGTAGHIGIGINSSATVGFYPEDDSSGVRAITGTPAVVKPDTKKPEQCRTINTSPEADRRMADFITATTKKPGTYTLTRNNCTQFVRSVLRQAGIVTPVSPGPRPYFHALPGSTP
jgi:RHS repeat-associated protein